MTPLDATEAFILQELKSILPQCAATPVRTDYERTSAIELAHPEWGEAVTLQIGREGNLRGVDIVLQEATHSFEEWQRKHRQRQAPAL